MYVCVCTFYHIRTITVDHSSIIKRTSHWPFPDHILIYILHDPKPCFIILCQKAGTIKFILRVA